MQLNLTKLQIQKSEIRNPKSIKNLVFDFGGVICNIDMELTKRRFTDLGFYGFDTDHAKAESIRIFEDIETGAISPQQFRAGLKKFFPGKVTDSQLDDAWNALLLDIPEQRIRMLEALREHYRIFLLSNTNEIHYLQYSENLRKQFGYHDFDSLFEKAYFSYRIGLKKPDPEIFRHVLRISSLDPVETLFIDDTPEHVESARFTGMFAYHLKIRDGEQITDLFTAKAKKT